MVELGSRVSALPSSTHGMAISTTAKTSSQRQCGRTGRTAPWVLLGSAETRLPSSTTGLLIAAVPLARRPAIAFATGHAERLTRPRGLGLALGIVGVAALVGLDVGGSDLGAVAEVGMVVVGYAAGPAILARPLQGLPGIGIMASALTITALAYVPVVLVTDGVPGALPSAKVVWSVVTLAVVCTAAAFMLLFALVNEVGPVRATTITYLNPAVAVVAGALVLSEPVTVWTVVGLRPRGDRFLPRQPRRAPADPRRDRDGLRDREAAAPERSPTSAPRREAGGGCQEDRAPGSGRTSRHECCGA